ncbi:ATP-binding domain-containing protein [uncultured Corynebacterium sp.]|uniref:HelD family protein n=1 Tax=uncultured Corynebacterium sp. TaxID=159447 RepID=UPI0025D0FAC4|nr:ATP-binding domain-containing protein [uncultured Corynebacterium sp.]
MSDHSDSPLPTETSLSPASPASRAVAEEQLRLDELLAHVDAARDRLTARARAVQRRTADIDHPQALLERDHETYEISRRLAEYSAAEIGLFFGRIDVEDADPENPVTDDGPGGDGSTLDRRYIGRIGLHADDEEMRTLLMDWRAPLARPFYLATTLHPEGVHIRRHIRTSGRTVTAAADERLSGDTGYTGRDAAAGGEAGGEGSVAREGALLYAVNRARSRHMTDIVDTIVAEQDRIIRETHRGVTVVQGGPGTGKTAVALHRTAYLLYTWREQLERTGVLIVGPNPRFLDYISQVLPSLGETGVVLATPGTLYPGIATRPMSAEPLLSQEVKGSVEMVDILTRAVRDRQTVPDSPVTFLVDGVTIHLTPAMVRGARTTARRSRRPHNQARERFFASALDRLRDAMADKIGADPLGGQNLLSAADRAQLREDLAGEDRVLEALDGFWPTLTPEEVLAGLYGSREAVDSAAADYDDLTREALLRCSGDDKPEDWTEADAPLLDELAEILGIVGVEEAEAEEQKKWKAQVAEAQEALDILTGSAYQDLDDGTDAEILMAYDVIDAEQLAERQRVRDTMSTAERAAADRTWAFGHVIVDEAQELSEMAWRMVFRRAPNRWMTLVGDPAQTGSPAGVESWSDALCPFVRDRWKLHELTVNYRTPADIAEIATAIQEEVAPDQQVPSCLRETGTGVRERDLADLADAVAQAAAAAGEGLTGLIGVPERLAELRGLAERTAEALAAADPEIGHGEIVVSDVNGAKGLEFDEVVLVEPAEIVAASPQGLNDVYVAVTRATQGLSLVHDDDLPW